MSISEFPWSGVLALVGVAVGFSLSQIADYSKVRRSRQTLKKALKNELIVLKNSFALAVEKHQMPKDMLPLITEVYDSSKAELARVFKPEQLSIIQRAYTQVKQAGLPMSSGKTLFRGYIEPAGGDHVIFQHDLKQEVAVLDQALTAISG
jgi:hypothetical protein